MSPAGAKDSSPRREPWEAMNLTSPGTGRKTHAVFVLPFRRRFSFAPFRGLPMGDSDSRLAPWATVFRPCRGWTSRTSDPDSHVQRPPKNGTPTRVTLKWKICFEA